MDTENLLNKLKIPFRRVDHQAVFTVEESNLYLTDNHPIKNLLLQDKSGQFILVIMSGLKRLDLKELTNKIGSKKLQFAKPEDMKSLLGVAPGSVSLFGIINDKNNQVKIVIENDVTKLKEVSFHPNDNTATVFFDPIYLNLIAQELKHEIVLVKL